MFASLVWNTTTAPSSHTITPTTLSLAPPAGSDLWRKTYYNPPFTKHTAPSLQTVFPIASTATVTTRLNPVNQFDQAGLFVSISDAHWIKFGFELCDDELQLGAVVTNDYSDWSTMKWESEPVVRLRVHRTGESSVALEAAAVGDNFRMMRIAHLSGEGEWKVGPFAAAPVAAGGNAVFEEFSIEKGIAPIHKTEL